MNTNLSLIGAPVETGASQPGCLMGPDALRTAGMADTLRSLGYEVRDHGNAGSIADNDVSHDNDAIRNLRETVGWSRSLDDIGYRSATEGNLPVFLGGDHSISMGSIPAVTRYAAGKGQPQFVLWLDAHPDFHTLDSTRSGNLHGTPVAYVTGQPGFEGVFPALPVAVDAHNVCMFGIRSVDERERENLTRCGVTVHDMRAIDEYGVPVLLDAFLERVRAANGALHVSLDVDFLDPTIAPAVGTTVPGGATFREAHLIMEMLHDSALVSSLDVVELNPFLDERGRTAKLMVDLVASLFGKRVMDRPTRSY
ncbi:arginase [Hoeflea prorocentri]|uniref:Arginase n=1 Tax=Hoeflea prorocentri TaxID=1922333 RepID=A0A9X3ZJ50_9HYPH|nr:arginase [Hoeflea prorocentri]MCY6383099.1 arginase [Hoeflea prorocentri]MDA5400899.1 arginase [Hoeflea prorocentri]